MRELYKKHPNALWHASDTESVVPKRILYALLLNTAFTIIEFIGGILSGSVAILADAVHDLGDSVSLAVAWYLEKFARREKNSVFSYGYGRFSLLSAVISGVVILAGMIYIFVAAVQRFWEPSQPNGVGMLLLALFGVAVNGLAAFHLSHGRTQNEKILTWHFLEDVLGWAAVLIGSVFIILFNWVWIDPLLAILVASYVGYNAIRNLSVTLKLMLQSVPDGFDPEKYLWDIAAIEGVTKAHDLHVWSMDGSKHILSVHVVLDEDISKSEEIKGKIRKLTDDIGDFHATIEIEKPHEYV